MKTFKNIREGAENYTMKKGPYTRKVDGKTADKMKRQGWKLVAREEIEEVRQMKDPKKDVMVVKRGKTIVIDKSKEKEYLRKGWSLAEDASLEEKISPKEFSKLRGTYKDKISGAVIEFDSQGFVVEPKNGKVVPFEWKNMMAEAVSQAQQAAIAIAKKEKGEKPKTEDKGQFIYAAKQAKKKGDTTFVFAGKTYKCEDALGDKEVCPKCEGKGCDHCDNTGYHEKPTVMPPKDEAHKKGSKCKTESFESFMNEEVANITVDPRNKISKPADQNKHAMAISKNAKRMGLKSSMMGKHVRIKGPKKKVNDFLRTVIGKSSYGDPTEKDMTTPQIDKMLNKGMKGKNEETELEEKRFSAKRDAMKDMGKSGKDSADDDDYKATDDDRKAASKNVISQIRRGCDMPKGIVLNFKDGSSKNFPKKACQLVMTKFDSIKKPMVKRKFQDMANQSFDGLKKALSMKG